MQSNKKPNKIFIFISSETAYGGRALTQISSHYRQVYDLDNFGALFCFGIGFDVISVLVSVSTQSPQSPFLELVRG
jgi:hypothetical protein